MTRFSNDDFTVNFELSDELCECLCYLATAKQVTLSHYLESVFRSVPEISKKIALLDEFRFDRY